MDNNRPVKAGLLGGTFNPIHLGHLRAAEEIRETMLLQKVFFIPSATPPHKDPSEMPSSSHRLKMVTLAVQDNPYFEASDIELKRQGPSYTIDTLGFFNSKFPGYEFYFIIGTDIVPEIDTWKHYRELFQLTDFVVISRPGFPSDFLSLLPLELREDFRYDSQEGGIRIYKHKSSHTVSHVEIEGLELSSTKIRKLLREEKSVKYLVPTQIVQYIESKGLYAKETSNRV